MNLDEKFSEDWKDRNVNGIIIHCINNKVTDNL